MWTQRVRFESSQVIAILTDVFERWVFACPDVSKLGFLVIN
jgi:hypothetical protein